MPAKRGMNGMRSCMLCNSNDFTVKHKGTRDRDDIDVLMCTKCGLTVLSDFEQISDQKYMDSEMFSSRMTDQEWLAHTKVDDERRFVSLKSLLKDKDILDFGCGNSGFLRKAQTISNTVSGVELDERGIELANNNGINVKSYINCFEEKYDYITMFHVLEHIKEPIVLLQQLERYLKECGSILIEVPNADDILLNLYESKAFADFTYWSFHLYLYNFSTLPLLIKKAGLKLNWIKPVQRYPISNHLYWLSKSKPGGHCKEAFRIFDEMEDQYSQILKNHKISDTIMCSVSSKTKS